MKSVDTHVHIWNFNKAVYSWLEENKTILARNYLIDELTSQLNEAGIAEGVLVQAANTVEETAYMLEVAEQTGWIKGVVGWLPLLQPKEVEQILQNGYARHHLLKGVRHLIHDEPDVKWLLQPAVIESLQLVADAGIPYDVVGILPEHLETVLALLEKVKGLQLVLDHLNQPPIQQGERFGRWGDLIKEVAKHSNVFAKISGLGLTTGKGNGWTADDIKPYVEFALTHFGVDRCFCGGDWPVCLLADSYASTWGVYQQTLASLLSEQYMQKVLYDNAKNFYKLG